MTQLTGIKDGEYLAQFLGKKIAIREQDGTLSLYPYLYAIFAKGIVHVRDSKGTMYRFKWEQCESPYIILQEDVEIILK